MSEPEHRPIVDEPFPRPQRWGDAEIARLTAAMRQSSLFYWQGPQTTAMLAEFRRHYPLAHVFPCSSGTASIHLAVAALRLKPGDEIILPPITDTGSALGILHAQLVPVFADIDPHTFNLDPAAVRRAITPKTRAILAVHLAGNPCDLDALMALAREHKLVLIEDCAQAWGAHYRGRPAGLIGDLGCWSFNDFKHLSCGDGGVVGTNRDDIGRDLAKWGDKGYDRITNVREPTELTHNYRMSEPLAAICAAQLEKLGGIVSQRHRTGMQLAAAIAGTPGIIPPQFHPEDTPSFYHFLFRLDLAALSVSHAEFIAALRAEGVNAGPSSVGVPMYRYPLFQRHNFFGGTWPMRDFGLTTMDYTQVNCPAAEAFIADGVQLPWNEAITDTYAAKVARAITTVARRFAR